MQETIFIKITVCRERASPVCKWDEQLRQEQNSSLDLDRLGIDLWVGFGYLLIPVSFNAEKTESYMESLVDLLRY